jgi:hypothetical protein
MGWIINALHIFYVTEYNLSTQSLKAMTLVDYTKYVPFTCC